MKLNEKLLPNPTYKQATRSSSLSNGWADYFEYGNIVVVNIQDLVSTDDITTHNTVLFTNLPKAKKQIFFQLFRNSTLSSANTTCRVKITTAGEIRTQYGDIIGGSNQYYGTITYLKQ